jgi:dTDP-4-dehydrorhamnose reductase
MNSNMTNVLVLGSTGMLGTTVLLELGGKEHYRVAGTSTRPYGSAHPLADTVRLFPFNAEDDVETQLAQIHGQFPFDVVINCIGIIKPYCKDDDPAGVLRAVNVNARFPHLLSKACSDIDSNIRIVQIATDCVYSGKTGNYTENEPHDALDVYGKTKSLGEVKLPNFLNIRCSIIGHEINGKLSLIEWFLSNEDGQEVNGFDHHEWNGVTTLQFAQLCDKLIAGGEWNKIRPQYDTVHYVINETVTKYEILLIFNEVYSRSMIVKKVNDIGEPVLRTIDSVRYPVERGSMKKALEELRDFSVKHNLYQH